MIKSSDLQLWSVARGGVPHHVVQSNVLQNAFPNLTGAQNRDLQSLTYCFAWVNMHPSLPLTAGKTYFRIIASGGATLSMGLAASAPAPYTGSITDTDVFPATFTTPTTIAAGLVIPTLNPGYAQALWIRRVATASAALKPEKNTITIVGTSAA